MMETKMERLNKFIVYRNTSILAGKILNDFVIAQGIKLRNPSPSDSELNKLVGYLDQNGNYEINVANLNESNNFIGTLKSSIVGNIEEEVPVDLTNIDKDLLLQILKGSSLHYTKIELSNNGVLFLSK